MLFTFESESKVDTILTNATWSFDKHLMILQKYDGISKIEDLNVNSTQSFYFLFFILFYRLWETLISSMDDLTKQWSRLTIS